MCIFTWIGNKSHPMAKLFYGQLPLCGCTTLENIQPVPNKGRNSPPVCPLAGYLVFGFCLPLRILSLYVVCLFFYFLFYKSKYQFYSSLQPSFVLLTFGAFKSAPFEQTSNKPTKSYIKNKIYTIKQ